MSKKQIRQHCFKCDRCKTQGVTCDDPAFGGLPVLPKDWIEIQKDFHLCTFCADSYRKWLGEL